MPQARERWLFSRRAEPAHKILSSSFGKDTGLGVLIQAVGFQRH